MAHRSIRFRKTVIQPDVDQRRCVKRTVAFAPNVFGIALSIWMLCGHQAWVQEPAPVPTIRVQTSLTLVDVVAEQAKKEAHTTALLTSLKRDDFRVFDNGREVPVRTFDVGLEHTTRPIALWLIVQCNMGFPSEWASMFMKGKTQYLKPALMHLDKSDVVGVAHWCDDGQAEIDVTPGTKVDAALDGVNAVLAAGVFHGDNRSGELAMQQMIRLIVDDTRQTTPARLPVLLFLYGDHSATYAVEANRIIEALLETSGIVFGLNDQNFYHDPHEALDDGKIFWLGHYYSLDTGGQYYSASHPELFGSALDYILTQLHLRYTLGFEPPNLDGKRHDIKVELTKDAQKRFPSTELRFRREYVALNEPSLER
jgi:hypothetical protein